MPRANKGCIYDTPHEAFPLLCFWQIDWICEIQIRQNQSVQLRLYVYMSTPPLPSWSFQQGYDTAKVTIIIESTKFLAIKFRKKLCEGAQMGRRSSLTWQGGLDFGECFHILSLFSTPSTFGTQTINTWLSTYVIFTLLFCTLIVTMNSGFDNESTKKKESK